MTGENNNRFHDRLHEYWDSLRGSRLFPSENQIDPDAIPDIWESCFLVSIDDVTRRMGYRYSYLGAELIEACGDDTKSPDVAMCLLATGSMPIVQKFDEVIRIKGPVIDESEFVNLKHLTIRYRTCLLPLGYNDAEVSHIIGCIRWRLF